MQFFRVFAMVAAAATLAACSPQGASSPEGSPPSPEPSGASQGPAKLTIKGLTLGMTPDQLSSAAGANGWNAFAFKRTAVNRAASNVMVGEAYIGQVVLDDATGLFYFELDTDAFGASGLSFDAFVEQLQASYPIGNLEPTHNFGNCGRWEGRGPGGEIVAVSSCGAWSITVTASAEQAGANFN